MIEPGAGQVADKLFKFVLTGISGKSDAPDMGVDVKVFVQFPIGSTRLVHGFLPEPPERQPPVLNGLNDTFEGSPGVKNDDAGNHHQVGGLLHSQPGGVDL